MSRARTWLLPFALGSGSNPADMEPVSWTIDQVMELYWRAKALEVAIAINATYDGETRDLTKTITATRRKAPFHAAITDEMDLIDPGLDEDWDFTNGPNYFRGEDNDDTLADWGGSDVDNPVLNGIFWYAEPRFFIATCPLTTPNRRALWTDDTDIRPALDLFGLLTLTNDVDELSITIPISNVSPVGPFSGTGELFGDAFTALYNVAESYTGPGSFGGFTVNSLAMTLNIAEWFEYRQSGGSNPVWNSTTGAQILDPLTASVP